MYESLINLKFFWCQKQDTDQHHSVVYWEIMVAGNQGFPKTKIDTVVTDISFSQPYSQAVLDPLKNKSRCGNINLCVK